MPSPLLSYNEILVHCFLPLKFLSSFQQFLPLYSITSCLDPQLLLHLQWISFFILRRTVHHCFTLELLLKDFVGGKEGIFRTKQSMNKINTYICIYFMYIIVQIFCICPAVFRFTFYFLSFFLFQFFYWKLYRL